MHIGNFVQKRGSKTTLGIITARPAISYCWKVLWTSGKEKGRSTLIPEDNLVLVKTK
jgi:hypothetical protein